MKYTITPEIVKQAGMLFYKDRVSAEPIEDYEIRAGLQVLEMLSDLGSTFRIFGAPFYYWVSQKKAQFYGVAQCRRMRV